MSSSSNSTRDNSTPWAKAYEGLRQHATKVTATYPEEEWLPAMRNQADELGLGLDVKDAELTEVIEQARKAQTPDYTWSAGDPWVVEPVTWILEGLIAEHRLHTIVAPAKVGKTTFILDFLFCLFSEQVQQYLNLLLNSNKKHTLYLVGADMCHAQWGVMLQASGLMDPHGKFATQIRKVLPEENEDGLGPEDIRRFGQMARDAKANGEEPIFVFDCYSTLIDNTPSIRADEISASYYVPLRKLKNEMSRAGATTIVLHHSSKSSRKNGAVDAGAGSSKFSRIPDVLIKLDWLTDQHDFDESRDARIVLNATGRIDPMALLIERNPDGRFISHEALGEAKRRATLFEEMCRLSGDYSRALDFIGNCDEVGQAVPITGLANQMNWDRFKAGRVMRYLEKRALVWVSGDTSDGSFSKPARLYRYWESKPVPPLHGPAQSLEAELTPPTQPAPNHVCAANAGSGTQGAVNWGILEPGTKCDVKVGNGWETGWTIKSVNKGTGEHEAWKYPDLSRTKCRLRAGLEVRETLVINDREAL